MYWIDDDQQIIEMANKETGAERQRVQRRMPLLVKVKAINHIDRDSYLNHPCAIKNGGCSHLCLVSESNKKRCSCPLDLVLSSDQSTCIDIPTCAPDKFRCLSEVKCLPKTWRCDGRTDCDDMSDEMDCDVCKPQQFRCVWKNWQSCTCLFKFFFCDFGMLLDISCYAPLSLQINQRSLQFSNKSISIFSDDFELFFANLI